MLKYILKESILYTLASNTGIIAGLIVTPLVTPYLRPEDYAILALALAVNAGLSPLGSLGMVALFQNEFFKNSEDFKPAWSKYLGFQLVFRLFFTSLVGIVLYAVLKSEIPPDEMVLFLSLILTPVLLFDITRVIGMRLCQWQHKHRRVHLSTLVNGILTAAISYVTIRHYELGYLGWFISFLCASAFQFVYFGYILYIEEKIIPSFGAGRNFLKNRLRVSLPIIPHESSAFLLDTADRLLLKFFRVSMSQIGLYSIAYSFGFYFNSFNNQVNTVVSPIYFKMYSEPTEETPYIIRDLTWLWLSFVLSMGFLLSVWSKEIFQFLYRNDSLNIAYQYAVFIIMALCYKPLYVALVDRIVFEEKTRALLKVSLVGGLINILLNIILIPLLGIEAALLATYVAYLYLGFAGFLISDFKKFITVSYKPLLLFLLIIGATLLAWLSLDLNPIWKFSITGLVCSFLFVLYKFKGQAMVRRLNLFVVE